jgi:hypothetical protein
MLKFPKNLKIKLYKKAAGIFFLLANIVIDCQGNLINSPIKLINF